MSDFAGMEDLLQDFLQEAHDLLSDVDNKLVELEKTPEDTGLLNDIFRGFHTVKGGAGFLNASELVTLCHLTENLFDRLRNGELELTSELMDVIMDATRGVRDMFGELGQGRPQPAEARIIDALKAALAGEMVVAAPVSAPWRRHMPASPTRINCRQRSIAGCAGRTGSQGERPARHLCRLRCDAGAGLRRLRHSGAGPVPPANKRQRRRAGGRSQRRTPSGSIPRVSTGAESVH